MDEASNKDRLSVRIVDVVEINPGIDKSELADEDLLPFVPMPAVEAETGGIDTSERRPFLKVKSGFTAFASGDVLFAKITPCMENGKMAIVPELKEGVGFGSTEFHVLRPTEAVNGRYLYYYVSSASFRHEAQHKMSGAVGQKRVPKPFIESKEIPLPPIDEQQRIVEKIEKLFARIDKGEEAVREVQKLLTRYRQSVLKSAVTGQLTKSDRSGWEAVELGSLLEDIRYGTAKKCGYEPANTAVLRIPNVVGGKVSLGDLKYTDLHEREVERLALELGDILIVRSNGSANLVARGAVVGADAVGMSFAGYLIRLRVDQERILPEYLHMSMSSPQTRQLIERQARSTSGVHNINSGEVKAIAIELPPIDEQREIMAAVDDAFQKIVDLERWCEIELKRSASLRQSILKDAFAGKLVPRDPNDEPSSALLARIAAEKPAAKKTRRKTPA